MPSDLLKRQWEFSRMLPLLITEMHRLGYEVTVGRAFTEGDPRCHGKKLAIDLNLFKNGVYLTKTEAHQAFGEYWERIGGSWGGRFKIKDGNHYSLAYNGKR